MKYVLVSGFGGILIGGGLVFLLMKRWISRSWFVLALLVPTAASADWTPAEVTELNRLAKATEFLHSATKKVADLMEVESNPSVAIAALALRDVEAAATDGLMFCLDAIASRNQADKFILEFQSTRQDYVARCFAEVNQAIGEVGDAQLYLQALPTSPSRDSALAFLNAAASRLLAFDQGLAYASPPGSRLAATEGYRMVGQYGHDAYWYLELAYQETPLDAATRARTADAIRIVATLQDDGTKSTLRVQQIPVVAGENFCEAIPELIVDEVPTRYQSLAGAVRETIPEVCQDPAYATRADQSLAQIPDSWKHADHLLREFLRWVRAQAYAPCF